MKLEQRALQAQKLILSPQMQQALHLLQLPVMELSTAITQELTQNPLLEYSDEIPDREQDDLRAFVENTLAQETSLYDHLMQQAGHLEPQAAELVIGSLDHDGFLTTSLEELSLLYNCKFSLLETVLRAIQNFDPVGVGARDLRESLLIQLKAQKKEGTLAFILVEEHFDAVVHNRIPQLAQLLGKPCAQIRQTLEAEIAPLDFHPGSAYPAGHYKAPSQTIIPDLTIASDGSVSVNDEGIPDLRLNSSYLELLGDPSLPQETHDYIERKIASGKWLLRNLGERQQTLMRIALQIAEKQQAFFTRKEGSLTPLTMKEIADDLGIHESTVARAVAGKHVACARGVMPLRALFTNAYTTDTGNTISSKEVRALVAEMIQSEDRRKPLSDQAISEKIEQKGIHCARRTVAKYRKELGLGNTSQRKIF